MKKTNKYIFSVGSRFIKYVKYDTQSNPESTFYPSSNTQKILLKELKDELLKMGLKQVEIDEHGYVIATISSNSKKKNIPTIAFIAHVDTSNQVSGKNVNPIIHKYRGGDIKLPGDFTQIIKIEKNFDLKNMIDKDIITSDGTTLLGSDDKAGIAEIMDAVNYLIIYPEVMHGEIKICFTPDEEVGKGTKYLDLKKLGAQYAYTLDGGKLGELQYETFNADEMIIKFYGKSTHPGHAKGEMINSIKIASEFMGSLPYKSLSPETTEGREGFIHCISIIGNEELTTLNFIIRDFEDSKLKKYEQLLEKLAKNVIKNYIGSKYEVLIKKQYKNMKKVIDKHPKIIEYAIQAYTNLGISPISYPVRGGTDGSKLSFRGLPTPNLFSGQHNIHSKLEWICLQDMEMAVLMIIELVKIWEEKS